VLDAELIWQHKGYPQGHQHEYSSCRAYPTTHANKKKNWFEYTVWNLNTEGTFFLAGSLILIKRGHTMKGLTCKGFATRSDSGWKVNITLSPQGVFVTWHQYQDIITVQIIYHNPNYPIKMNAYTDLTSAMHILSNPSCPCSTEL
jgi:hypothetical protein